MDEIRTKLRKGQKTKLLVMTLLCLVSAVYGGWQYWFRLPEREQVYTEYMAAVEELGQLEAIAIQKKELGTKLSTEQIAAYEEASAYLAKYADDKPQPPSKYDGLISLIVWFLGGLSGIPFLLWPFWKYRNGGWILHEDGSLRTPKGVDIPADEVTGIDMSTWRGLINPQASNKSTWQARLLLKDKRDLVLDDYPWDGVSAIIGQFAHHYHPETWGADGEPIKDGVERASAAFQDTSGKEEGLDTFDPGPEDVKPPSTED